LNTLGAVFYLGFLNPPMRCAKYFYFSNNGKHSNGNVLPIIPVYPLSYGSTACSRNRRLCCFTILLMNPFEWYMLSWSLIIAGPAFLVGILFFINWFKKKNLKNI
jgi:hypothetical protein